PGLHLHPLAAARPRRGTPRGRHAARGRRARARPPDAERPRADKPLRGLILPMDLRGLEPRTSWLQTASPYPHRLRPFPKKPVVKPFSKLACRAVPHRLLCTALTLWPLRGVCRLLTLPARDCSL